MKIIFQFSILRQEVHVMEKSLIEEELNEVWKSYLSLVDGIMAEGALSAKIKELMAVVLSIAGHCEPCIRIHLRRAIKLGATRKEIAESIAVTLLMMGGPIDVWTRSTIKEVMDQLRAI
jgi:AhpD family alkylhydroperoxidase